MTGAKVNVLHGAWSRLRGLKAPGAQEGAAYVVLVPCASVHTCGMAYAIDVAFADARGVVIQTRRGIGPGRCLSCAGACMALERKARAGAWFRVGDAVFAAPGDTEAADAGECCACGSDSCGAASRWEEGEEPAACGSAAANGLSACSRGAVRAGACDATEGENDHEAMPGVQFALL